jgi:hypothetical protein
MTPLMSRLKGLDWADIANQLDQEGYALLPGLLLSVPQLLSPLRGLQRVSLASCDLGQGDLYVFHQGLPEPLSTLRQDLYPPLAEIANRWNETLGIDDHYPAVLQAFLQRQRKVGPTPPLSHISELGAADYVALHQHAAGHHVFPLQLVGLLSAPDHDFTGGELVMTEQRPRMQSRPMVLPLRQGDAALVCTTQRPCKGRQGTYRVKTKQAISPVRSGTRTGLELSFCDAP